MNIIESNKLQYERTLCPYGLLCVIGQRNLKVESLVKWLNFQAWVESPIAENCESSLKVPLSIKKQIEMSFKYIHAHTNSEVPT